MVWAALWWVWVNVSIGEFPERRAEKNRKDRFDRSRQRTPETEILIVSRQIKRE
jgi:hypothetical protein